jgi:hypothetical protein
MSESAVSRATIDGFLRRWEASGAAECANYSMFLGELCDLSSARVSRPRRLRDLCSARVSRPRRLRDLCSARVSGPRRLRDLCSARVSRPRRLRDRSSPVWARGGDLRSSWWQGRGTWPQLGESGMCARRYAEAPLGPTGCIDRTFTDRVVFACGRGCWGRCPGSGRPLPAIRCSGARGGYARFPVARA